MLPKSMIYHLLIGVIFTLLTLIVWAYENKHLTMIAYKKLKNRSKKE